MFELGLDVGEVAAHEALDGVDGVGGVGEEHVARGVADGEALRGVLVEGYDGGDDGGAVFAGDDGGGVALHEGDERVGGAEVDADDGRGGAVGLIGHCFLCFRGRGGAKFAPRTIVFYPMGFVRVGMQRGLEHGQFFGPCQVGSRSYDERLMSSAREGI